MSKLLENYKDQFTLDGELTVHPLVTKEKLAFTRNLQREAKRSRMARAQMSELFTSSDLAFSLAHLWNINTIPELKEQEDDITGAAGERVVNDFRPAVLKTIFSGSGLEGAGIDANGAAAIVPEGTSYPFVTSAGSEEAMYSKLSKRGVRFDFTFESFINDFDGMLDEIPTGLNGLTSKTRHAEYFDALLSAPAGSLAAYTLPDGTVVPANSKLTPEAIFSAMAQIGAHTINGVAVGDPGKLIIWVARGQRKLIEWQLQQLGAVIQVVPGAAGGNVLSAASTIAGLLPAFEVRETGRLAGTEWVALPAPGEYDRPVLDILTLRGYENPEIRVRADQSVPLSGVVQSTPFGAFSFDADTSGFRYRTLVGAALWTAGMVVRSTGAA